MNLEKLTWKQVLSIEDEAERIRRTGFNAPNMPVMIAIGEIDKWTDEVYVSSGHPMNWQRVGEYKAHCREMYAETHEPRIPLNQQDKQDRPK